MNEERNKTIELNRMVVVLSGYALATVFGNSTICDSFFKLLVQCKSVLCCRVTPKQKVG